MEITTDIRDNYTLTATLREGGTTVTVTLTVRDARRLATELEMTAGEVQRRAKAARRGKEKQLTLNIKK